jgi:hypothetical protein
MQLNTVDRIPVPLAMGRQGQCLHVQGVGLWSRALSCKPSFLAPMLAGIQLGGLEDAPATNQQIRHVTVLPVALVERSPDQTL